jgi:hypothetical protein
MPDDQTDTHPVPVTPAGPLALVQAAIEKGAGADELGKIVALVERIEANRALAAFNVAMNEAQANMPAVVRNKVNAHTKKAYADLEAVNTAIKPVYTRGGLSLSFGEDDGAKGEGMVRVVCDVAHTGGHTKRYFGDFPLEGKGMKGGDNMTPMQGRGSSLAYARRYMTLMIFNVTVADEDNDGADAAGCISEAQTKVVNDLIRECGEARNPVDVPRFLNLIYPGTTRVEDIPLVQFGKALHFLEQKKKGK